MDFPSGLNIAFTAPLSALTPRIDRHWEPADILKYYFDNQQTNVSVVIANNQVDVSVTDDLTAFCTILKDAGILDLQETNQH